MAKSSRKQIEADEKKVLLELQKNCKESLDKIAKRCGFSRQKTWRILKYLEKNIVDRSLDKAGAKIGVIIEDSYWVHGAYDGMVIFTADSLQTAKKFYELFKCQYPVGTIYDLVLVEKITTIKKNGFINPDMTETKKLL
ncbi:MAG: winged helix-turn-helix transcriptional regulator [Methanobacteriota archaeon]